MSGPSARDLSVSARNRRTMAQRNEQAVLLGVGDGTQAIVLETSSDSRTLTVGRMENCAIHLDYPGVSRVHANLRCYGRRWELEDVSLGGTLVHSLGADSPRVLRKARSDLVTGDYIRFGSAPWLIFENFDLAATVPTPLEPRAPRVSISALSKREREVVSAYLAAWLQNSGDPRNREIAGVLHISVNTLKTHLRSIFEKWDCADRHAIVQRARESGLLPDDRVA